MCYTFAGLGIGAIIFIIFEVISIIIIKVWICSMFASMSINGCFCMNYSCSVTSCVCHYIAIIGWLTVSGATYSNSCSTFHTDGTKLPLCSQDGPDLGLFLMLIMPIIIAMFIIVACKAQKAQLLAMQNQQPPPAVYLPAAGIESQAPQYNSGVPPMYGAPNYPQYVSPGNPQYPPGNLPPQYLPGNLPPQYPPGSYPPQNPPQNPPGIYPQLNPPGGYPQMNPPGVNSYPQYDQSLPPKEV